MAMTMELTRSRLFLRHSQPFSPCACPLPFFRLTAARKSIIAQGVDYSSSLGDPSEQQPNAPKEERSGSASGEAAKIALARATGAVKQYGWIGFWIQLTLSMVSSIIILFSVSFTSQSGPKTSLYLTLIGIVAGFFSCYWNFVYTRTGQKMQQFLSGNGGSKIKKQSVIDMVSKGVLISIAGMGCTLYGIQSLLGILVSKTLSGATANTSMAGHNPVLALDIFLVQAGTTTLLAHFLSLICSLWLLNVLGEGTSLKFP